jgi:hypothetical protein
MTVEQKSRTCALAYELGVKISWYCRFRLQRPNWPWVFTGLILLEERTRELDRNRF